ncbi:hypothetical protein BJY24_005773 [Nocardia transvalensis]|uniref:Mce-associated membrane protein n=1 Tax=Nocardia transvalensis TaxID=37333 RepID=A0A7W9UKU6_9NOCA|nr:hypothetical protein [Nocardia transvalensis]MBB5916861.1 hypothetical protein [Nocardia transvalensis]
MRPATATLALTLLIAAAASGCAHTPDPDHAAVPGCATGGFAAPFDHVDGCSPDAVLAAATATIFGYRPVDDPDQRAAFRRATPLLDPDYARLGEPAATVLAPVTAEVWQQWAAAGVTVATAVEVTDEDHPPDTGTHAARVLTVTLEPGDLGAPIRLVVRARAVRATPGAGWRLSALEVSA